MNKLIFFSIINNEEHSLMKYIMMILFLILTSCATNNTTKGTETNGQSTKMQQQTKCYSTYAQIPIFVIADNLFLKDGVLYLNNGDYNEFCHQVQSYDEIKFKNLNNITLKNSNFEPWMKSIRYEREELENTLNVMREQYFDLSKRLTILHGNRKRLIDKYNDESFIEPIDEDIKYLSAIGMKLAKVTKRFFKSIKPKLQQLDLAKARQEALKGLRYFESKMDQIHVANYDSLETIVSEIEKAVKALENSINR